MPFGPSRRRKGEPNGLRIQARARGRHTPDPPTLRTAVPNWGAGDTIPLGRGRSLRVTEVRLARAEGEEPVLVVEPASIDATP